MQTIFKILTFKIIQDSFSNINKYFSEDSVDGILYDLGTCSTHFDDASRGSVLDIMDLLI